MNQTIAIVEDNIDNQMLFEALLDDRFDVVIFDSGPPALEAFARLRPHAVLLDISLPEMDGLEVLRRIRTMKEMDGVPIIALTAHAMSGDKERFLSAGFDDYVAKPIIDEQLLFDAIDRHLGG